MPLHPLPYCKPSINQLPRFSPQKTSPLLLPTLGAPRSVPFLASSAHGIDHNRDTSVVICGSDGTVIQMTTKHHAGTPAESTRLRRVMGSTLVTDSFGEERWMGVLENTRSLGDFKFKQFGVTPEPGVRGKLLKGNHHPSSWSRHTDS